MQVHVAEKDVSRENDEESLPHNAAIILWQCHTSASKEANQLVPVVAQQQTDMAHATQKEEKKDHVGNIDAPNHQSDHKCYSSNYIYNRCYQTATATTTTK